MSTPEEGSPGEFHGSPFFVPASFGLWRRVL